jgi:RimJ/RimL family protein N-acetyltransferase
MELQFQETVLDEKVKQQIWEILCECDDDFVPRLSARESSAQKDLTGAGGDGKPYTYFNEMIKQCFVLAFEDDGMAGFMTFKRPYICDALEEFGESAYITTICVKHEMRNKGILKKMYAYLEDTVAVENGIHRLSTRTWSQNHAHIHVLEKLGFRTITVLPDDRGPGIDTVYFGKEL